MLNCPIKIVTKVNRHSGKRASLQTKCHQVQIFGTKILLRHFIDIVIIEHCDLTHPMVIFSAKFKSMSIKIIQY